MKRSVNEIQGVVLKAARGAGLPLGICEDLSAAVPYMFKNNAIGSIVQVLNQQESAAIVAAVSCLDRVACGQSVPPPAGLVPAVYDALSAARGLGGDVAPVTGAQDMNDAVWGALSDLAMRTYVPSSDASRTAGAGAGLTDND
jgi:hypothetical protein